MRKKAVQQGRSERRGESYSVPYVEPLRDARTPLAAFFRILLDQATLPGGPTQARELCGASEEIDIQSKLMVDTILVLTSTGDQGDMHGPLTRAVEFDQHHRLPRAEHQLSR